MKKRTAFIAAILSLIPFGQPLLIKAGAVLSTTGLMLAVHEKVHANDAVFYYNRANEKFRNNDYYGAISDYTKAIEINPNYAKAFNNRGYVRRMNEDYYGAIADAIRAIEINPNYGLAYANLGTAKDLLGDIEGACADWKTAFDLRDQSTIDWFSGEGSSYCQKFNF